MVTNSVLFDMQMNKADNLKDANKLKQDKSLYLSFTHLQLIIEVQALKSWMAIANCSGQILFGPH